MEQVILLTPEQAESLKGRMFAPDSYFYVRQDIDDNYFITIFEQDNCSNFELQWVKSCPKIEYRPKPIPMPDGIPLPE